MWERPCSYVAWRLYAAFVVLIVRIFKIYVRNMTVKCYKNIKSSQVNTLPKAKSKTRSKQNKDMHKCSSVYSERGVPLPVLTSGGE
jgi:hypothetical protein